MLEKSVAEKCWRRLMQRSVQEKYWRRVLWRSVAEEFCGEVSEKNAIAKSDKCWRGVL